MRDFQGNSYIDRINYLKKEKKITNERLSELTGIPMGTLSKIMAGMSDSPKVSTMISICEALDCSLEYLVTGVPENTNNYTLEVQEIRMIENYRRLDEHGRELTALVIDKESERVRNEAIKQQTYPAQGIVIGGKKEKKIPVQPTRYADAVTSHKRNILLYDMPASAGTGVYLDDTTAVSIVIPRNEKTADADFAIRISGNSMEPKYHSGDILLVEDTDSVEVGELGIFVLDGDGYFKMNGGDCLLSMNEDYGPIKLSNFSDVRCLGRVVGKIHKK